MIPGTPIAMPLSAAFAAGVMPSQVELAGLLARNPWIVPIPETTKTTHVEENVATIGIQLTAGDLEELESGFPAIRVRGARSSDAVLALIDDGAKLGSSS